MASDQNLVSPSWLEERAPRRDFDWNPLSIFRFWAEPLGRGNIQMSRDRTPSCNVAIPDPLLCSQLCPCSISSLWNSNVGSHRGSFLHCSNTLHCGILGLGNTRFQALQETRLIFKKSLLSATQFYYKAWIRVVVSTQLWSPDMTQSNPAMDHVPQQTPSWKRWRGVILWEID